MKKFVLDTNVILTDPNCIRKFEENEIYIPIVVVEELDGLKKGQDEKARNAREFARILEKLRCKGSLATGVDLKNGGKLFVTELNPNTVPSHMAFEKLSNDDKIIWTSHQVGGIVISRDINVRIKANAWGFAAENYKADKIIDKDDSVFKGSKIVSMPASDIDTFRSDKFLAYEGLVPNEYLIMKAECNEKNSALGRYSKKDGGIVPLIVENDSVWGIHPRNAEQRFAMDALLNDDLKLVSLMGKAGTGKTLLAVAAGLNKTLEDANYKRMLVSRPIIPMGKDLGYLPGDINEKMDPWMQPIYDNLDHLFGTDKGMNNQWSKLVDQGLIKIEALTYIRGRSIPQQFLIVDEAQNLSAHEMKTIITRVGENTKIVLTGDYEQIDNPYLDSVNNGLTYVVEKMKEEEIVAHIELTKGERSVLADIASRLL